MYLPCIFLEKGGQSPLGDLQESYVVVTYNGSGYNYYYTGKDTAGYGITLTAEGLLDENSLKPYFNSEDKKEEISIYQLRRRQKSAN